MGKHETSFIAVIALTLLGLDPSMGLQQATYLGPCKVLLACSSNWLLKSVTVQLTVSISFLLLVLRKGWCGEETNECLLTALGGRITGSR